MDSSGNKIINGNFTEVEKIAGIGFKWSLNIPSGSRLDNSFAQGGFIVDGGDTVKIIAVSPSTKEIVTDGLNIPFKIRDDDPPPGTLPVASPDTSILASQFKKAYILPKLSTGGGLWTNQTNLPFKSNLRTRDYNTLTTGNWQSQNIESSPFWIVYVIMCWQGPEDEDLDPSSERLLSLNGRTTPSLISGAVSTSPDSVVEGGSASLIFLATLMDPNQCTGTSIARNIAHEIGHQFGLDHGYIPTSQTITIPEVRTGGAGLMHFTSCQAVPLPAPSNTRGDNLLDRHINYLRSRTGSPGISIK